MTVPVRAAAAQAFRVPARDVGLREGEVHVWRIRVPASAGDIAAMRAVLGSDERAVADRLCRPQDATRYVVAHAALRTVLGGYLGRPPSSLQFRVDARGKPHLDGDGARDALRFSLTHAGGLALCAVSPTERVGIDVELVEERFDYELVAAGWLSPGEREHLRLLPLIDRPQAFFRCWTAREAYLKATGEGLSGAEEAGRNAAPLPGGWTLRHFVPEDGYTGALAVEGDAGPVTWWDWTGTER